ncbi:MAG: DUF1697 domain-containing protein [Myxococcales bacterium]|nr:DUF1697 domain-containing protein [Myxococcales bacterium]MCB9736970.1 DUF1697 domain-containing protein [Deltaproteobacteria bacterium]
MGSDGKREPRHVALLRAVNLGPTRKLPMAALREMLADLGATDVETYIASGNAVYGATAAVANALPGKLEEAIEARFGFECPVITRSAAELADTLAKNPFLAREPDDKALHVQFLAEEPAKAAVDALDPEARSPGDEIAVVGRDVYLWLPNGVGKSKLDTTFWKKLGTPGTARNWRTVQKLAAMAEGA